jgi:NADH-quinone oxidoreductase subunit N
MLMALATLTRAGVEAMLFYLVAYLFMNLGAFAVVAFLRNQTRSEDLDDFRGLIRRSPVMVITLCVFLLSLLGIPPLVGFMAKFQVFAVLFNDAQAYDRAGQSGLSATLIGLLVIGGLNTVLSAFYYVKVMKVMILDRRTEDLEGTEPTPLPEPMPAVVYTLLLALATLGLGVWQPVHEWTGLSVARFRNEPAGATVAQAPQEFPLPPPPVEAGRAPGKGKGKDGAPGGR